MSVDLGRSLHDLALSVHDEAVADRMSGQVRHMVTRIRRRRAARQAATGVVGVGAASAVALGGLQLAGRPDTTAPAWSVGEWGCGRDEAGSAQEGGAALVVDHAVAAPAGGDLAVHVGLELTAPEVTSLEGEPTVTLVRDGAVVSQGRVEVTAESFPPQHDVVLPLESCRAADDALPTGSYEVVVRQQVLLGDSRLELEERRGLLVTETQEEADRVGSTAATAEPGPRTDSAATAAPGTVDVVVDDERAQRAALDDVLARAPRGTFPQCGSAVLSEADPLLSLDLTLEERPYAPGEGVGGPVAVRANGGRTVLANAPLDGARLVLTQAGVVVGGTDLGAQDVGLLELSDPGPTLVTLTGAATVCDVTAGEGGAGGDGPTYGLPPGRYDAFAVMEVGLKEVVGPDGVAEAASGTLVVRSEPVAFTVE